MYYLYVKTHNKTGLKYLGKTEKEDWHTYPGSGSRWINHLKRHGYDYTTEILLATNNKEELIETGIYFSKIFNIVDSKTWANLREETGDGGDTSKFIDHEKRGQSISKTMQSKEWKEKVGESTYRKISETEKKTKSSTEWKSTVGASVSKEASRRQNDREWIENGGGKIIREKARKRWSNPDFKSNISLKISKTQNDPNWKIKHYKKCDVCERMISPGNYKKHFRKCLRDNENK